MKYKAEFKIRPEEKVYCDRKQVMQKMLHLLIDQLSEDQLELLVDLKEYDPKNKEHFNSDRFHYRPEAYNLWERLTKENIILYRATLNLPD